MSQYRQDLSEFLKKYRCPLCFAGFLLVLSLYHFLFSSNYRMDTIIKQVYRGDEFNDMELGRFGIVLFNRLFGMRIHNPYLSAFLTILTLLMSNVFLSFMLWKAGSGRCGLACCFVPFLVYLTPNWIEQMYFSYQTFIVVFGVFLLELAVFLTEYGSKKWHLIPAVLLCFSSVSIYQAFVPLYLSFSVGLVLLRCLDAAAWRTVRPGKSALRHAVVLLSSVVLYFLVNTMLQRNLTRTGYLGSQIHWGAEPLPGVLRNIFTSIKIILTGGGEIDTITYSVSAVCCILLLVLRLVNCGDRQYAALLSLGWIGFQLTAFAMLIVLGGRGYIRTELSLPVVSAVNFLIALLLAKNVFLSGRISGRYLSRAVLAACFISFYMSAEICFRLIYTDDVRFAYDVRLAGKVINRVEDTGAVNGKKPIVFIGSPKVTLDASCISGEVIGRSMFHFLNDEDTTYTLMSDFLSTQGLTFPMPRPAHLVEANLIAADMPDFPEQGAVLETDKFVIVKFSDDLYFDFQSLKSGFQPSEEAVEYGDGMLTQIERITSDGHKVRIQGFNLRRGTDPKDLVNTIYLLSQKDGKLFRINTARKQVILPSKIYWRDGIEYDTAGFAADIPISLFVQYSDSIFDVLIRCEEDGKTFFVPTGVVISKDSADRIPFGIFEVWDGKR